MTFERRITIMPAFDKRHEDPKKNYGIHGCDMRFVLIGPGGAVQFLLFTNWQLPHVAEETRSRIGDKLDIKVMLEPMPADLGYHSPKPMYDGQRARPCDVLPGGECYYDGSGLAAEDCFNVLVKEGSDGLWKHLENYYRETFPHLKVAP